MAKKQKGKQKQDEEKPAPAKTPDAPKDKGGGSAALGFSIDPIPEAVHSSAEDHGEPELGSAGGGARETAASEWGMSQETTGWDIPSSHPTAPPVPVPHPTSDRFGHTTAKMDFHSRASESETADSFDGDEGDQWNETTGVDEPWGMPDNHANPPATFATSGHQSVPMAATAAAASLPAPPAPPPFVPLQSMPGYGNGGVSLASASAKKPPIATPAQPRAPAAPPAAPPVPQPPKRGVWGMTPSAAPVAPSLASSTRGQPINFAQAAAVASALQSRQAGNNQAKGNSAGAWHPSQPKVVDYGYRNTTTNAPHQAHKGAAAGWGQPAQANQGLHHHQKAAPSWQAWGRENAVNIAHVPASAASSEGEYTDEETDNEDDDQWQQGVGGDWPGHGGGGKGGKGGNWHNQGGGGGGNWLNQGGGGEGNWPNQGGAGAGGQWPNQGEAGVRGHWSSQGGTGGGGTWPSQGGAAGSNWQAQGMGEVDNWPGHGGGKPGGGWGQAENRRGGSGIHAHSGAQGQAGGWAGWGEEAKRTKVTFAPSDVGSRNILSPQQHAQILNSLLDLPQSSNQKLVQAQQALLANQKKRHSHNPQQVLQQQQSANLKGKHKLDIPPQGHDQWGFSNPKKPQEGDASGWGGGDTHNSGWGETSNAGWAGTNNSGWGEATNLGWGGDNKGREDSGGWRDNSGKKAERSKKGQKDASKGWGNASADGWGQGEWGKPQPTKKKGNDTDYWKNDDDDGGWSHVSDEWNKDKDKDGWGTAGKHWDDEDYEESEDRRRRSMQKGHNSWQNNSQGDTSYTMPSKTLAHAYKGTTTSLNTGLPRNSLNQYTNVDFVQSKRAAIDSVRNAFFSKERLVRDRIHWMFPPNKDERVANVLTWIETMSYNLGTFGLHQFLQSRERGALFTNVDFRHPRHPKEPAFDWLTFDELQLTMDRVLQESVAAYNPAMQVIVFVFLPSKSGNSVAMWRRKINIPNNPRLMLQGEINLALSGLRRDEDYVVHLDEVPTPTEPLKRTSRLKRSKTVTLPPPVKPKKRRWWHFFRHEV